MTVILNAASDVVSRLSRAPAVAVAGAALAGVATLLLVRAAHEALTSPVPGPFQWPLVGNLFMLAECVALISPVRAIGAWVTAMAAICYGSRSKVNELLTLVRRKYGKLAKITALGDTIIVLSDAAAAKLVLNSPNEFVRDVKFQESMAGITDFVLATIPSGDLWKKHRKLLQPAFGPTHLRHTAAMSKDTADLVAARLRNLIATTPKGTPVVIDAYQYFTAMTLDVIGKVAFSHDFESVAHIGSNERIESQYILEQMIAIVNQRLFSPKPLWGLFGIGKDSPNVIKANSHMRNLVQGIIKTRRDAKTTASAKAGKDAKGRWDMDVLGRLLENNGDGDDKFSDEEIIGEMIGFFIAGHDTTANTLTFILMALCQHPDVMRRLVDEIDQVYKRLNGNITTENLHEFSYLDWCVRETQRLYPVFVATARTSSQPVKVMGHAFPPKTDFFICIENIHRDADYWTDPNTFNPDRWIKPPAPGSYLPFSDGPMNCIGQKMASIEIRVLMIHLIRLFEFRLVPDQKLDIVMTISTGLKHGLKVMVSERLRK